MNVISGERMCRVLERDGWALERISGSHHVYQHQDRPLNVSVPVHVNADLTPGTQRRIMRIAELTDEDL